MKRIVRNTFLFFFLAASLLSGNFAAGEQRLTMEVIGQIVPFSDNAFSVNAPDAGHLKISVSTNTSVYRIIETEVNSGHNKIEWDGLGFNQEKLYPMNYRIDAELACENGTNYQCRINSAVYNCAQALTLALPSSLKLYLSHPKEWFIETKVIRSGTLVFEMIQEGKTEPAYRFQRDVEPLRINRITFADIAGKTKVDSGIYTVRIYEMTKPQYSKEWTLIIENDKPDPLPVSVTGEIMPDENDDDETVWNLMTQPAVVVDIESADHQPVYESPDEKAASLGTLHGQTQSLEVISIEDDWALIEAWNHEEGEKVRGWVPFHKLKAEMPNNEYGLLVNKKEQTIAVYRNGKKIETISVCTGKMEKNKLFQETAAGSFLTGEHRVDYSANGNKYDFVIQYDGGNLIHQIPYRFGEGKKDFSEGRSLLGKKGSHACIRVQSDPGEIAGINAYWIWTHIPYHTRIFILDDPEERRAEKEAIQAAGSQGDPAGEQPDMNPEAGLPLKESSEKDKPSSPETPAVKVEIVELSDKPADAKEKSTVVLTFGGDAVLGGREWYYCREDSLMSYVEKNGYAYPFSGLKEFFATDDLTSVNLECVLKDDSTGEDESKRWRFRGLPEYTEILTEGSVELVNIANNHTIDYGDAGYKATIEAIEGKVAWCGRNHPTAVKIQGHLIGFGGCRETTYKTHPGIIEEDIQVLKDAGCEYIVYQCHWGNEYDPHFNAIQQTMAHICVNAGADLVIGHHPHVVQGMDYIDGTPVIYSLGNLCFGGTIELDSRGLDAILARVQVTFGPEKPETKIRIIPIRTSSRAAEGINDFRPVPAESHDAARILKDVQNDSGIEIPR